MVFLKIPVSITTIKDRLDLTSCEKQSALVTEKNFGIFLSTTFDKAETDGNITRCPQKYPRGVSLEPRSAIWQPCWLQ